MSQPEFTIEDILSQLGAVGEAEGITADELIEKSGRSEEWVHRRIRQAVAAGTMEYAGRKAFKRVDGLKCMKPVYRLKKKMEVA